MYPQSARHIVLSEKHQTHLLTGLSSDHKCVCVHRAHLGVLSGQEALLEAAVHGQRDERDQPPVFEESERGQEGVAEGLAVCPKLTRLGPVDVVQEYGHDEHGQHAHACRSTQLLQSALCHVKSLGQVHISYQAKSLAHEV